MNLSPARMPYPRLPNAQAPRNNRTYYGGFRANCKAWPRKKLRAAAPGQTTCPRRSFSGRYLPHKKSVRTCPRLTAPAKWGRLSSLPSLPTPHFTMRQTGMSAPRKVGQAFQPAFAANTAFHHEADRNVCPTSFLRLDDKFFLYGLGARFEYGHIVAGGDQGSRAGRFSLG